jgi:hypothetical protein
LYSTLNEIQYSKAINSNKHFKDGLLLDTERVYTEVTQQILDKHTDGKIFSWEVKNKLMGRTGHEVMGS